MSVQRSLCVVLDANAWMAEWLLFSAAGSTLIDLIIRGDGRLLLPDIVEREVRQGTLSKAQGAVQKARAELSRLRQLTGREFGYELPATEQLEGAIAHRLDALKGLVVREAYSFEIAQAALERVLSHRPPSHSNNEQFRDSCIWEHCKRAGLIMPVHFVTGDTGFYQGRKLEAGLDNRLEEELRAAGANVRVHATVSALTLVLEPGTPEHDDEGVLIQLNLEELPFVREKLARSGFELGDLIEHELVTLPTQDPLIRSGSFRVVYSLSNSPGAEASRIDPSITLRGSCEVALPGREITNVRVETDTLAWTTEPGKPIQFTTHHLQIRELIAGTGTVFGEFLG